MISNDKQMSLNVNASNGVAFFEWLFIGPHSCETVVQDMIYQRNEYLMFISLPECD